MHSTSRQFASILKEIVEFFKVTEAKIDAKSQPVNNGLLCIEWFGTTKFGPRYTVTKISPPGHRPQVKCVHSKIYLWKQNN